MTNDIQDLVQAVLESSKYRHIHPGFVEQIGAAELAKGRKFKEAVKATKNKLHQVGGAYFSGSRDHAAWLESLQAARANQVMLKLACRKVMAEHTSTQERLPILEDFYRTIFTDLPLIHSIIDIACGLNPLAIPWMDLPGDASYYAYDIYQDMVSFVDQVIRDFGLSGGAETADVIAEPPTQQTDLAFILKTIPCLEQVDKQAGERLLEAINAKYLVVSFPAKSLGGRNKGMIENYGERFTGLVKGKGWGIEQIEFETELVFIVEKG